MLKKWLPTILIALVLLGLGIYALFTMTDVERSLKKVFASAPDIETVQTYFPSDEITELGRMTNSYTEGKDYVFLVNRRGSRELLLLPKDFNGQDINKRTYMIIHSGDFLGEDEVHPVRISLKEKFLAEKDKEVTIKSVHSLTRYTEGEVEESIVDFYKVKEFLSEDEILFYQDDQNFFRYKGEIDLIEGF